MAEFQEHEAVWVKPFGGSGRLRATVIGQVPSPLGAEDKKEWYMIKLANELRTRNYAAGQLEKRRESIDDATGQEWNAASAAARSMAPVVSTKTLDQVADTKRDVVNDPQHYGGADNPYEVIKVLEAWGLHEDAYLFNVIKYLARAGKKDKDKDLQDHQKALYYLKRKIANMEKESK